MPTSAETVRLVDTSVALPLLQRAHPEHTRVRSAVSGMVLGLAGHAAFETYSTLTRIPQPFRLGAREAMVAMRRAFPLAVDLDSGQQELLDLVAEAGIAGGSVYDALVGWAAVRAGLRLLSRDPRAAETYLRLGVEFDLLR